jgi:L-threonylcarbamoyladenylate synthase
VTARCLRVDPDDPDPAVIGDAADAVRHGGVVAYPTDTFYGLAVDPRREDAVGRLFELKGRAGSAAIPLIASDMRQALAVGTFGPAALALARAFWPGPLTIVVPAAEGLSRLLSGERATLGVRVPAHAVARALAGTLGAPITATSANLSGQAPSRSAREVIAAFGDRLDLVLDGGDAPGGPPSTLVELVHGRAILHRNGAIAWERVLESLE